MAILMLLALCLQADAQATRVELVIDEPFAGRTVRWPVTTGVPFPRGALASAEQCRLVDDTGAEQPLQARAAATWDAQGSSVRWLTIDFLAQPGRCYTLEFGHNVRRKAMGKQIVITQPNVKIVTGPLEVQFLAEGPSALGPISVDVGQDGTFTLDEVVACGSSAGDHFYLDHLGQRYSSAGDGAERTIVVETAGPVRACVRVDGFYTGPKGERIARYRTRYHFFAGLPLVKVVDELRFVGSTKETRIGDIGFGLDLKLDKQGKTVSLETADGEQAQPLTVDWQPDTRSIASYQATYRHLGNQQCEAAVALKQSDGEQILSHGSKAGDWMQVADGRCAVTGSLRWFWQQFPKEWQATDDRLVLHLWSPRGGELDFGRDGIERFLGPAGAKYLRSGQDIRNRNPLERFFYHAEVDAVARGAADGLGINKHHEFYLHFAHADRRREGAEYGRLAANQPLALASGAWNCGTDVFGPLAPRPNLSEYEAVVDRLFDLGRQMQDEFGDYGWWLFGAGPHYSYNWDESNQTFYADSRRFDFHTYGKETQLWWNYLRSGERKFYDWALPAENHWVDIAVCHVPTTIQCGWRGGEPQERTLHWRPGEWSIDSPIHYVRHHDRAEAWLRGGAQFWASYHRTLETTSLAYYLTGDERFNDVLSFWRDYWADLAGKHNQSRDIQPWHRQQAWYKAGEPGQPAKSWAEMIRDYAPFGSGTRHNLTLFFNLATLYEHTWDERIGLALGEYADAFLDPGHPIGTWRPQDDRRPANAEAPSMAHFWAPALWKYARVTQDARMPDIFRRYFTAAYAADPFRQHEHVGVYSNSYAGYAYYFTRDRRFLSLAVRELNQLLPFGEPLTRPQDINRRLYNPFAPIRAFAGVPRLVWALEEAQQAGIAIPAASVRPQRTAIALYKAHEEPLTARLWSYEPQIKLVGPDARPFQAATVKTSVHASQVQPFDRVLPKFEVYLHELSIPASAAAGYYLVAGKLETAVLEMAPYQMPLWNAARPLWLDAGEAVELPIPAGRNSLRLESASPASLRICNAKGELLRTKITGSLAEVDLSTGGKRVRIESTGRSGAFRIGDWPEEQCWVIAGSQVGNVRSLPERESTMAALPPYLGAKQEQEFVEGRFGQAVQIVPGRSLHVPDHIVADGVQTPLFDRTQGAIEFWVRKKWDDRLTAVRQVELLGNGLLTVPNRPNLPFDEWAHVALVWTPYRGDPDQTMTYVYADGRDLANYRSLNWAGYSSVRPTSPSRAAAWRKEFVSRALPGAAFDIDELRVSSTARYADPLVVYGPQQTFNPVQFSPPAAPFEPDSETLLLLHFDGGLHTRVPSQGVAARLE
jgi:hypothetical protein